MMSFTPCRTDLAGVGVARHEGNCEHTAACLLMWSFIWSRAIKCRHIWYTEIEQVKRSLLVGLGH